MENRTPDKPWYLAYLPLMTLWPANKAPRRVEFIGRLIVLDRSGPTERVAILVRRLLAKRSIERPVGYNDDLSENGLSSLDLVNLMLAVEAEFGLKIPELDMRPTNFRSIARIEALITRIQDQA